MFLAVTCLFGENVCALLCGNTAEDRKEELEKLYNQESVSFNTNCPKVNRLLDAGINWPITAVSTRSGDCTKAKRLLKAINPQISPIFRFVPIFKCWCVVVNDNILNYFVTFWIICRWFVRLEHSGQSG